MRRLVAAVKGDIRLQIKYGFYAVYAIVTLLYIILLRQLPTDIIKLAVPLLVFIDPSLLGFFFIGGLVLFEKGENTLEFLIATPLRIREYLFAKIISLTFLAVLTSLLIIFFSWGVTFHYLLYLLGVILTSSFFILIGFVAVARFKSVNEYLFSAVGYTIIFVLPLLDFFGVFKSWLFYLIPSQASLLLIEGAFTGISWANLLYAIGYLLFGIYLVYKWAYRSFYRFIILKRGD